MAFTYDLTTDTGKVRLELGDTTGDGRGGVRPDGQNLQDEEIAVWLSREGGVMRAVAAACEALSRQWSIIADTSSGPLSESAGAVAGKWAERARGLRDAYGFGDVNSAGGTFAGGFIRETE
jgi:hypothetical protein